MLHPVATSDFQYTDNVLGQGHSNQKKDELWSTSSGFEFNYKPTRTFDMSASYRFGWNEYLDNNARDYLTHEASLNLAWHDIFTRGLEIDLGANYNQTGNTGVLEQEFLAFTRIQTMQINPSLTYRRSKLTVSASYYYDRYDYFGRTTSQGDLETHGALFLASYNLSDFLTPYFLYSFAASHYFHEERQNFDTHELKGGLKINYGKFAFNLELGNEHSIRLKPYDSDDGNIYGLRLDYKHNEHFRAHILARRDFEVGILTGGGTYSTLEVGCTAQVLPRFETEARFSAIYNSLNSGAHEMTKQFNTRFTYQILRNLKGYAEYNRDMRTSVGGPNIDINTARLGMTFRW